MAIPYNKTRMIVTLTDKTKSALDYLCEKDKRNPSKELEYIIESFLESNYNTDSDKLEFETYFYNQYKPKQIADSILSIWRQVYNYRKVLSSNITEPPFIFSEDRYQGSYIEKLSEFKSRLQSESMLKEDFINFNTNNIVFNHLEQFFHTYKIIPRLMSDTFNVIIEAFYKD